MVDSILAMPGKILRKLQSFLPGHGINTSSAELEITRLNFHDTLAREYPNENLPAQKAVDSIVNAIAGVDLTALALHSPGLKGFDWSSYLQLSTLRMVRVQNALSRHGFNSGRVADIGSYFGNFSLMLADNGYEVTAVDSYSEYGAALQPVTNFLKSNNVAVHDFGELGDSFQRLPTESFDIVLSMGVIEHIPHTPRLFLEAMNRILRPGGLLVLDTPNLGYLYTREKLSRGESIFCPLELQYETVLPFEGHHREYTQQELRWMLKRIDHELLEVQMFNFSMFALSEISGSETKKLKLMEADENLRELMLSISRKKPT